MKNYHQIRYRSWRNGYPCWSSNPDQGFFFAFQSLGIEITPHPLSFLSSQYIEVFSGFLRLGTVTNEGKLRLKATVTVMKMNKYFEPNSFPNCASLNNCARGVMVIVVGNGHGDTSSNPRPG